MLLGTTIDVSPLLCCHWYQPVLYAVKDTAFQSESKEASGHFVGVAPHTGHAMTHKMLSAETQKVLWRSNVHPTDDRSAPKLRLANLFNGETPSTMFVKSNGDPYALSDYRTLDAKNEELEQDVIHLMTFVDTSKLLGSTVTHINIRHLVSLNYSPLILFPSVMSSID